MPSRSAAAISRKRRSHDRSMIRTPICGAGLRRSRSSIRRSARAHSWSARSGCCTAPGRASRRACGTWSPGDCMASIGTRSRSASANSGSGWRYCARCEAGHRVGFRRCRISTPAFGPVMRSSIRSSAIRCRSQQRVACNGASVRSSPRTARPSGPRSPTLGTSSGRRCCNRCAIRRPPSNASIAELLAAARAPTLFGDRPRLSVAARRDLATRRRHRTQLRSIRRRLARDAAAVPFAVAAAFAPVFARRGGFDLVVGNPPWVRAERLPPATRARARRPLPLVAQRRRPGLAAPARPRGRVHRARIHAPRAGRHAGIPGAGQAGNGRIRQHLPVNARRRGRRSTASPISATIRAPDSRQRPIRSRSSRRGASPRPGIAVTLGLDADGAAVSAVALAGHAGVADGISRSTAHRCTPRARPSAPREQITPQLGVKTGANAVFLDPPEELAGLVPPGDSRTRHPAVCRSPGCHASLARG